MLVSQFILDILSASSPGFSPGDTMHSEITHRVSSALIGWSFTGIALTALIIALAVSNDARKVANIVTQLISIQFWYIGRKIQAVYRRRLYTIIIFY